MNETGSLKVAGMHPAFRLWLDADGRAFGEGPAALLDLVAREGSLRRAAAGLGMSYNKAWRVIRAAEDRLGFPLLERNETGGRGGGSRLSPPAVELLSRYHAFRADAERDLGLLFDQHFAESATRASADSPERAVPQSAHTRTTPTGSREDDQMRLSARNQLKGTVETVTEGSVNGVVVIKVGADTLKADITMDSIRGLGLEAGKEATVVIKATNVMIATGTDRLTSLSARNQLRGVIRAVAKGAVNGHVTLKLDGGDTLTASITNEAIDELGLAAGMPALGVVKATDVMVAV